MIIVTMDWLMLFLHTMINFQYDEHEEYITKVSEIVNKHNRT